MGLNKFFLPLISSILLISIAASAVDEKNSAEPGEINFDPDRKYTAEEISQKVCAVHATPIFPANMTIISGRLGIQDEISDDLRGRVHFSLGSLVMPHGEFSWEDRKFAIIMPLSALIKQLANLNTYDTFVLGDVRIPPGAIIVMADDQALWHNVPKEVHKVIFKAGPGALREAVDKALTQAGCWQISMENEASFESSGTIQGKNINTADFFADFLTAYPYVSWGCDAYSQKGTAFRFQAIDLGIGIHGNFSGYYRLFARYNLEKLEIELTNKYPPEAKKAFNPKLRQVKAALHDFRPNEFRDLKSAKAQYLAIPLYRLPKPEMMEMVGRLSQMDADRNWDSVIALACLRRTFNPHRLEEDDQNDMACFSEHSQKIPPHLREQFGEGMSYIFSEISVFQLIRPLRGQKILSILSRPEIGQILGERRFQVIREFFTARMSWGERFDLLFKNEKEFFDSHKTFREVFDELRVIELPKTSN